MDNIIRFNGITLGDIISGETINNNSFDIDEFIESYDEMDINEAKNQILQDLPQSQIALLESNKKMNNDYNKNYQIYNEDMFYEIEDDKIRKYFYDLKSWPSITNILCWSCCRKHKYKPKFIPINKVKKIFKNDKYIPDGEHDVYEVYGSFCSFYCALWYLNKIIDDRITNLSSKNVITAIIYKLFAIFHPEKVKNRKIIKIPYDICRNDMIQFGGELSYDEYDEYIKKLEFRIAYY